ncbi:winged helix-turn-helix transcriptional regulator [Psychromicrobium lacuslunae]|uniref:HxlR family transcriptional regulator n=1 Tax=Psychromicrobium lacuslunae TaxID=1618207 RepID=A0A0D4C1Z4_9MICC|nr:helix-turn-helix domain-containing protein [Psychromicrobium lacuslunae]AJT42435.1 HxlR family transcriptional regulator [Psychromicrobium lacuslunae]
MTHQTVSPRWDQELVPSEAGQSQAPTPDCPVEVALAAVSGRWTTLLLRNLISGGPQSYSELAASLPELSDKVLTERLDELRAARFVEKTLISGFPARSSYRITEHGLRLRPLLIELYRTGTALQAS